MTKHVLLSASLGLHFLGGEHEPAFVTYNKSIPPIDSLRGSKHEWDSYLPSLLGLDNQQPSHEYLYWEFYEQGGKQAVRYGQWKGIRLDVMKDRNDPIELYNIVDDSSESQNLADQYPEIVARIAAIMEEAHETPAFEGFRFEE